MRPRSTKLGNCQRREKPYDTVLAGLVTFSLAYGPSPVRSVASYHFQSEALGRLTRTGLQICEDHQLALLLCCQSRDGSGFLEKKPNEFEN